MSVTIYHNPDCGTSRNVLAALERLGTAPTVIEYLRNPPDAQTLARLIAANGMAVRDTMRVKGTPYKELGLDAAHWTDQALVQQMLAHPILINRPLVSTPRGTRLCRPSDVLLDLVDVPAGLRLEKEEGVPFLRDTLVPTAHPALGTALAEAGLAMLEAQTPGRFYAYTTTTGEVLAYAGVEIHGQEALLRSLAVQPMARRRNIGRNVVALLLRRALEQGARRAWLLTEPTGGFFQKIGFRPLGRESAPHEIQATVQMRTQCPASAALYTRQISL